MLGAWRFGRALGRETTIFWPPRGSSYAISTIFDIKATSSSGRADDLSLVDGKFEDASGCHDLMSVTGWPEKLRRNIVGAFEGDIYIGGYYSDILFEDEDCSAVDCEKRSLFKALLIDPSIKEMLDVILERIGRDFVAVHIRRGDIVRSLRTRISKMSVALSKGLPVCELSVERKELVDWIRHFVRRAADLDAYLSAVASQKLSSEKIVIFSDSKEDALAFQNLLNYGGAELIASFGTRLTDLQQAFLEILVMMNARSVISTDSNFGKFACKYGDPGFTDARIFAGAARSEALFWQTFADLFEGSSRLKEVCSVILKNAILNDEIIG